MLDSLLPLVDTYKDRVNIVHVDIYKNLRTDETSPTVTAEHPERALVLRHRRTGKITTALDGAIGQDEMKAAPRTSRSSRNVGAAPHEAGPRTEDPKNGYENDWPQPQVAALGFEIVNPAPWRPSL